MDLKMEFEKHKTFLIAFATSVALFIIVYLVTSERIYIFDKNKQLPKMEYIIQNGITTVDYQSVNYLNPFVMLGLLVIACALAAYEKGRTPYRMSIMEALTKIDEVEWSKHGLPSKRNIMFDQSNYDILTQEKVAWIRLSKNLPERTECILYIDLASNFKSYSASPVISVYRGSLESREYHVKTMKALCKKAVFGRMEAIHTLAQTEGVAEIRIQRALDRLREEDSSKPNEREEED